MLPSSQKRIVKVVFLDRDGVINYDSPNYIKNWDEFEFLPGSLEALRLLSEAGYGLIVITNQSMIGRGMVPPAVLDDMHQRMKAAAANAGGQIDDIFFCPHRPDERCECRKPEPGLIRQACERYGIDPAGSVMIGDSAKDILCGLNAGCASTILVHTGNGISAEKELADRKLRPGAVVDDLLEAARLILREGFGEGARP